MRETERIVSSRLDDPDAYLLDHYIATGGYEALRRALTELSPEQVRHEVKESGLTGRSGGAAFATAAKWDLLAEGDPRYLVVNGDESEPGFFKDRAFMEADPHQLIEGALLCAYVPVDEDHGAVGAPSCVRRVDLAMDEGVGGEARHAGGASEKLEELVLEGLPGHPSRQLVDRTVQLNRERQREVVMGVETGCRFSEKPPRVRRRSAVVHGSWQVPQH